MEEEVVVVWHFSLSVTVWKKQASEMKLI